jgi:hypothetical protein
MTIIVVVVAGEETFATRNEMVRILEQTKPLVVPMM